MLGYVHFDRSGITNEMTEILVSRDKVENLVRNKYVRIVNPTDAPNSRKEFLGRIVEGPFFHPEEIGRDSALAQTSILKGESFPSVPNYYAVGGIEILGELRDDVVFGVNTRPAPQAEVHELSSEEIESLLTISGDMLLGNLDGYPDVKIFLKSDQKKVIPRNIGIFGTVGSGKTNTAQVIIEELSKAGYAVIVVDVEGEYVEMDKSTIELVNELKNYEYKPEGLTNFEVFYPSAGESERSDAKAFTIKTADIGPLILSELIEAEEAQERRLLIIIDDLKKEIEKRKRERKSGTLKGVIEPVDETYTLRDIIRKASERAEEASGANKYSYFALMGKLGRLNRTGAFDARNVDPIDPNGLLKSGKVSIFDVSYCRDVVKNVVIANLLRKVFDKKIKDKKAPNTLVIIEEAHTFISRETRKKMEETIEMLREISRRGRKRWLGLCFVSQQPAHLPNEIFELCNTRIAHNIKSKPNLDSLKLTAGDVSEQMWNNVPTLGTGQAVISSPQFRDPIVVNIRPCKTRRKFIE